ncbi:MAG: hypothetical protein IH624_18190 [Phycisphaerae bacterium]|nr:hypothetical protein [Phycisphaerae bacterium]
MADLKDARLIYLKGFLFLLGAVLAAVLIVLERPTVKVALLVAIAMWCAARFYYFAFYVIQHYIDDQYKFAGLWSFVQYLMKRRGSGN